jgi:heat shock protein HslJ
MRSGRVAVVVLALLALAGCGDRSTPTDPGSDRDEPLRGRTFLSTAVTESGTARPLVDGTRVSLRFTDDGRLLADAGCNTLSGPVTVAGGRLEVAGMAMTEMACDPARHEQDTWLGKLLEGKPSWRLDGTNLVVASASTELVLADREVAEPDLALRGTKWTVDTLVDGEVVSSVPATASASLLFEADTVAVSSGCNSGSAGYQVSGESIRFGDLITTDKACDQDATALEQAVQAVLQGEVTATIDSDRLVLTHPSGKGLQLRGER